MERKYKRRKYFIHPSSQGTYIALSIFPALIMSFFCTYFLAINGELVLRAAEEKPLVPFYSIRETIITLEKEGYTKDTATKVKKLKYELNALKNILETTYLDTLTQWNKNKRIIFVVVFCVLLFVGLVSLLYSHRIAGPLYNVRRCIDMLYEGKDIPPIRLRKHDEYKELAESLDKLRGKLKDRGLLESE
jgi:signal transduction histidine kinase